MAIFTNNESEDEIATFKITEIEMKIQDYICIKIFLNVQSLLNLFPGYIDNDIITYFINYNDYLSLIYVCLILITSLLIHHDCLVIILKVRVL